MKLWILFHVSYCITPFRQTIIYRMRFEFKFVRNLLLNINLRINMSIKQNVKPLMQLQFEIYHIIHILFQYSKLHCLTVYLAWSIVILFFFYTQETKIAFDMSITINKGFVNQKNVPFYIYTQTWTRKGLQKSRRTNDS